MNIDEIKQETSRQTGVDIKFLDYITEDLLKTHSNAKEEQSEIKTDADGNIALLSGVYCNSLWYDSGPGGNINYKRADKGTPNYGCGTDDYTKSKQGTTVQQIGSCSGGRIQYLVSW